MPSFLQKAVAGAAIVVALAAPPSHGVTYRIVEDFRSSRYRDPSTTTAWWDSVAGQIKLYPVNLQWQGSFNTPGSAYDVAVTASYALVADNTSGLQIIDVSVPASPTLLGSADTPGTARGVAVLGIHAYVADGASGLQVIDISDPSTPAIVGSAPTSGFAQDVVVNSQVACVAMSGAGLQVFDLGDPTNPEPLGALDTVDWAQGVALYGEYACVADGNGGLQVLDITHPSAPNRLGGLAGSGDAFGVGAAGLLGLLADGASGLQLFALDPDGFNTAANQVQSLAIDDSEDPIVRARLSTLQTDSISWQLSADGGLDWEDVVPGEQWHDFAAAGRHLRWRSTHVLAQAGQNPTCWRLVLEWQKRHSFPEIQSILDIPEDTGGQVRIEWSSSRLDSLESPTPITEYAIFRRQETPAPARASGEIFQALVYPPGNWDYVLSVPANCETEYATIAPTLFDATPQEGLRLTVFFVRARTAIPGVFFDSPPDSGYSMDNSWPTVPEGSTVSYGAGGNQLTWDPSPDADFAAFRIYRADDPDFTPGPESLVHTTAGTAWFDAVTPGWGRFYLLSATDQQGRESIAVPPQVFVPVAERDDRRTPWLGQNIPNPCNPLTIIPYELPSAGPVNLRIFDLSGHLVRVLVLQPQTAGPHTARWDGTDRNDRPVASGVYISVLGTDQGQARRTLTLLR